jgi:hypothetical protein
MFVIFTVSFAQEYGWIDISENIQIDSENFGFTDVFFINDVEGWVAIHGYYSEGGQIQKIFHTTDGGESFEAIETDGIANAIHFLDSQTGYIGMQEARVFKTTDGGDTWTLLFPLTGTPVRDISFYEGSTTGYCCGDNSTIYKITADGLIELDAPTVSNLLSISTFQEDEALVCGESTALHIHDEEVINDQGSPLGNSADLHCFEGGIGYMVGSDGWSNTVGIVKKTNNLSIWQLNFEFDYDKTVLATVYFLTGTDGWAAGYDGVIIYTTDGGNLWNINSNFSTEEYQYFWQDIFFTSPTNGFVAGQYHDGDNNYGKIYKFTKLSGIADQNGEIAFEIYPNPAKGKLNIFCSEFKSEVGTIEILSIEGRTLQKKTVGKENEVIEINLTDLAAGMYLCRITLGIKSSTSKLFIE